MAFTAPDEHALPIPSYGKSSLADLTPSLLSALGVAGLPNPLQIEPLSRACLLVIDGLGAQILQANEQFAPYLASRARLRAPLTTGFPSTTAASLASIGTGLPPGEHGIVGYTMAVAGGDRLLNSLTWQQYASEPPIDLREAVVPEKLQPRPTAFERAAAEGIAVTLVGPARFSNSGLTRAALRGGRYRPAIGMGDLVVESVRWLAAPRSLVYAYHADLDSIGHLRGTAAEAWKLQLGHIDLLVKTLAERLPPDAALVVTGDHGMVDLQPEERIDVDDLPTLVAGVRLVGGEARARHIYTRPGAEADVCAAWREVLGERLWVLRREEAIASGLFGATVSGDVRPRIGDVVAFARGAVGIVQRSVDANQAALMGHHGSVTPAEQLVPLLVIRR